MIAGHFNKSIIERLIISLDEVVISEDYYIKGEESNVEKKVEDVKQHTTSNPDNS